MKGFQLSLVGALLFLCGLVMLIFLPVGPAIAAIVVGGMLVWGGFTWTIFGPYVKHSPEPPPEA